MLDDAATHTDNARIVGLHRHRVEPPQVGNDVQNQARIAIRMEVQHVAQAAVRQRRTEDGDFVFRCPIVDRFFVIDSFAQTDVEIIELISIRINNIIRSILIPLNHLRRSPQHFALILIGQHFVKQRYHPVLELAVVLVRHQQIANAIDALVA